MQCDSDFAEVKGNKFFLTYIVFHLNGFMYGLVKVLFSTGPAMQCGSDDQVQDSAMKGGDDDDAGDRVQVCFFLKKNYRTQLHKKKIKSSLLSFFPSPF